MLKIDKSNLDVEMSLFIDFFLLIIGNPFLHFDEGPNKATLIKKSGV